MNEAQSMAQIKAKPSFIHNIVMQQMLKWHQRRICKITQNHMCGRNHLNLSCHENNSQKQFVLLKECFTGHTSKTKFFLKHLCSNLYAKFKTIYKESYNTLQSCSESGRKYLTSSLYMINRHSC